MVRLWLVDESSRAAYPVCNPFDAEEIVDESQATVTTPKMDAVFDEVRVNIPVKITAEKLSPGFAPATLLARE